MAAVVTGRTVSVGRTMRRLLPDETPRRFPGFGAVGDVGAGRYRFGGGAPEDHKDRLGRSRFESIRHPAAMVEQFAGLSACTVFLEIPEDLVIATVTVRNGQAAA